MLWVAEQAGRKKNISVSGINSQNRSAGSCNGTEFFKWLQEVDSLRVKEGFYLIIKFSME